MWLFVYNNVNVSVKHYLFVFGTIHFGFLGKSVTISVHDLQKDFYNVSNC